MPIAKTRVRLDHPVNRYCDRPSALGPVFDHRPGRVMPWPRALSWNGVVNSKADVPPRARAYAVEIFGVSAGVLVANGNRFVFWAVDPRFWDLDQRCFTRVTQAEKAAHESWLRHQHRGGPGAGFGRRGR